MANNILTPLNTLISDVLIVLANAVTVLFMPLICSDFTVGSWYNSVFLVIGVGIANVILWPIFTKLLMKFITLTFGIGALIANASIFLIVSLFIPGVSMGIWAFMEVPLVTAIVTTFVYNLTHRDYYDNYVEKVSKYALKQNKAKKDYPGLIMLEIDGLSKSVLEKALDNNIMPTLNEWIDKTHTLKGWETDLSSQTGASQAGILHGNNRDIVAYRWVEKEFNNRIIVSGKLSDAPIIEKRISNGQGLLTDGISITNMFSGDSENAPLTSSRIRNLKRIYNKSLNTVFLDAYTFQRVFILFLWDILVEIKSQIMHYVRNIQPRIRRNLIYATVRAGANVLLREVTTEILTGDILTEDIDTAYATYMGYDEVAHHSGVEDDDVWNVLRQIDKQFARLKRAVKTGNRNYEIVILSDHGQGNGATFKQRYSISLGDFVRRLLPDDLKIYKTKYNTDHFRDAFIPENPQLKNILEKMDNIREYDIFEDNNLIENLREGLENIKPDILEDNTVIENLREGLENIKPDFFEDNERLISLREKYSNSLEYIKRHESKEQSTKKAKDSELIVLGSGNLGLIYLTQWKHRLSYEEIVMLFPDLIPGLVNHQGIGFILVNSIANGGMVIGKDGIYYLDNDKIVGDNPLEGFGDNASKHLKRHNSFNHMPDILVNSFYDEKSNEICAFEELIGSHGGLGGDQSKPFIVYPSSWDDPGELVGAKSVYSFLKKEIENLKNV